jgi:hypothetical protein
MLSVLQEKLAEAHGLALAASWLTEELERRIDRPRLLADLDRLRQEAGETRSRCLAVEGSFGAEPAAEMLAHANTVDGHLSDVAASWLKAGTDPLSAWSFLVMGEAAEVAAWSVLDVLAERGRGTDVRALTEWGLPVQERHLRIALDGAVVLAERVEPHAARWG